MPVTKQTPNRSSTKKAPTKRPGTRSTPPKKVAKKGVAKTAAKRATTRKAIAKAPPGSQAASMNAIRDQRARKLKLQADKMEREMQLEGGETILRGDANEEIQAANYVVRSSLAILYKTLPQQLEGLSKEEMEPIIKHAVERAQSNLCEELEEQPP